MADSYRPPGYDWNRRGSSPGRPRDRDYFPSGRPAAPSRSFSNMDGSSRRPNPNPGLPDQRKRNASQSPVGGQARKQPRQEPQQNGIAPNNLNDSRRSSTSAGNPNAQPAHLGAQSPGSPKLSAPPSTIRKPSDAAVVSSPRSPRESVTSGRSTPQPRPSALSNETTAQLSDGVTTSNSDSSMDSQFLPDLLNRFSTELAVRAALEHEKNQAEARWLSAQREYNEMKKHFTQFPSIKERKSAENDVAREALQAKEKLLKKHASSQASTVGALGSLLRQLATVKPGADVVSRVEYESLQNDLLELKQEVTAMKQLRNDVDTMKNRVPTIEQKVDWVIKEHEAIADWRKTVNTRLRDVDKLDQRLKTNETRYATQKDLDDFKEKEASKFATKQQISDLETKVEPFSQKLEHLQKAQSKATADSLPKSQPVSSESFLALKQDVSNLQTLGADLKGKTEKAATAQETATLAINQLEVDVVGCKDKLDVVRESIEEDGKEVIVKRVKRLDVLFNNLSSKVGDDSNASMGKRLSQLECDFKAIHKNGRTVESSRQTHTTTDPSSLGSAVDLMPLETRLSKVEKDLKALDSNQDEKDDEIIDHVNGVEIALKEHFSKELTAQLSNSRDAAEKMISGSVEKMTNAQQELQKSVNGLEEAIRSKVDSATLQSLKSDVSSMSDEVKKLQANHQRAKSLSQTPTPASQGTQANGHYQATPQSHQLPNGVIGSPQVNGVQQSYSPRAMQNNHGHGSTQHASNAPQYQKVDDMQIQINGLVAVTQQLKMRCDNLQTDDIVRSMLDQLAGIYPDARNVNNAMQGLRNTLNSLQQQLAILQQQKAPASEHFADDIKKATAKAEGASNTAHSVFEQLQKVWSELNPLRTSVTTLENEVAKKANSTQGTVSNDSSIRTEVNTIREALDKTTQVATAADRLSRSHATRLSKVVPENLQSRMVAVETRIGDLDTRVVAHDLKFREGKSALEEMKSLATSAKNEATKVGKNFGALKHRVEQLEESDDE